MALTNTEEKKKEIQPVQAQQGAPQAANNTQSNIAEPAAQGTQQQTAPITSQAYSDAIATLTAAQKNAPTYAGTYDGQLRDMYEQIVNRDKFKYDIDADALYEQYAEQYRRNGSLAMRDTMGQAAGLTGGYGSSYGQAVGQQQFDAYMQQLNDVMPELYGQAYQRYQDEGTDMQNQYNMLGSLADEEYGKYQDAYNRWLSEQDQAAQKAGTLAGYGDFSGYEDIYGADTAEGMKKTWISSNPDLAYRNGLITPDDYKSMTGKYPAGYTPARTGPVRSPTSYDELYGAISNMRGNTSKLGSSDRSAAYKEAADAVNDAYKNGDITAEQKAALLKAAIPNAR